jgi:hypothetical protein
LGRDLTRSPSRRGTTAILSIAAVESNPAKRRLVPSSLGQSIRRSSPAPLRLLKVQRTPQSPPSGLQWVLLATIPLDEWIGLGATQYVLELEAEGEGVLKPMAPMSER